MKALVIGLSISGKSACIFLEKRGYEVIGIDDQHKPQIIDDLAPFSLIVVSPGVSFNHPLCTRARSLGIPIKGEAQIALEGVSQTCIGVTGTNGKTTVVKMLEHCLKEWGKKTLACGNVGIPLTSCVGGEEILVIELSSYQLETLTAKVFDVGIILNIAEDHLDRYPSMVEYAKAKAQLQNCIKDNGQFFVSSSCCGYRNNLKNREFGKEVAQILESGESDIVREQGASEDPKFVAKLMQPKIDSTSCFGIFTPSLTTSVYQGGNLEAVRRTCLFLGMEEKAFVSISSSFVKPSHRLEFIAEIRGVQYYNDSKATNVAAVIYALEELQKKVIILLGGRDKGISFAPLQRYGDKIAKVIAFGEAREKIANALQGYQVHQVETMQEATQIAMHTAKAGDTVLLSPGCASFDAFTNFEARGETFKRIVREGVDQ